MVRLLQQISIPPAAALSNPTYTPAADGWVGFVPDPVHEMGPHVIPLVVRVELFNVRDAEAFPLTCIFKVIVVHCNKSPLVVTKHCCKINILVGYLTHISIPPVAY